MLQGEAVKFQTLARRFGVFLVSALIASCGAEAPPEPTVEPLVTVKPRPEIYADFTLTADLSQLSDDQLEMIKLLIDASRIMDDLFWKQSFGEGHEAWLETIPNFAARRFAELNYGPWDRLDNDKPFIDGVGAKPLGAGFYPADMSKDEFNEAYLPGKGGLYSLIRRNEAGELVLVPYHVAYAAELSEAAGLLRKAAKLAESSDFANYLKLRAAALISDEFQISDRYWMDVKDNDIDVVIGPIETYEDRLFGYRAAYESYVLIKDLEWSDRLSRFAAFLPDLQEGLPVADEYKWETPGTDSDLNAYDVVYYAGHSNAGSKTIAINLPNDEEVQLDKGTRRLQLKNAMRAKFEKILEPIADVLIDESQREHITFDAFFANTMFHEVAHGLGIKNTINGSGTVREAMLDLASSMEEGKADILGLYMITELHKAGELGDVDLRDYYTTFMASVFRSIRFGASSAHGKANMVRFNFFLDEGAFNRDAESGRYSVDYGKMESAMTNLSRLLLTLQGDGDYDGAAELTSTKGVITTQLQSDLDRLTRAKIPVDITFQQGVAELGIE
ncbi:MAG: Zn-dependent hydrolase [Gammaproteobacteria bacterium]|nr:Zn-dependent hydrolase [Gammaproteobacteria bacterium]MBU2677317.1 Zn-dependent hydrolase [Gammaproteobacteria bacterium]NNC57990.1 Zn-dependent hydrolase [Woeseiaceae bacterium]NNL51048.1 Zn-dependent hydrolase [Woeseiaceae bacterium]